MINCHPPFSSKGGLLDVVSLTVIFQDHMAFPHPISNAPAAPHPLRAKFHLSLGWGT